jgi:endonuclease YncB( thermonuclease family)
MAESDLTDLIYPSSAIDILSIDNKIDALARQWLVRIQTSYWQMDAAIRTRVTWFNEQHYNPLKIYEGILPHYAAVRAELDAFKTFLDDNNFPKSSSYYLYYDAYDLYYQGYADIAKPPALVQEEFEKGKLIGVCDRVDDGDTLFLLGKEVRLAGIDTQEKGTFRGAGQATQRLRELVVGKTITVYFDPHTPLEMYRRVLGAVYIGDGDREDLFARQDWKQIFVNYILVNECIAQPNDKGRNQYIDPDMIKGAWQKCKLADYPDQARLQVKSKPTHARIFVNGKDVNKITPDHIDVTPGVIHLTVAADGYSALHEDILVSYGENTIFRQLLQLPVAIGTLSVFTDPDDCEVILNDMPQGVAPIIGMAVVTNAPAIVTVTKDGYKPKTVSILPIAGRNIDLKFDPLEKA